VMSIFPMISTPVEPQGRYPVAGNLQKMNS